MDSPEFGKRSATHDQSQIDKRVSHLRKLLERNQIQQVRVARKIAAVEKKQDADLRRTHVREFIKTYHTEKGTPAGRYGVPPPAKRHTTPSQDPIVLLVDYELRKETLVFEQKLIESKINDLALQLG